MLEHAPFEVRWTWKGRQGGSHSEHIQDSGIVILSTILDWPPCRRPWWREQAGWPYTHVQGVRRSLGR